MDLWEGFDDCTRETLHISSDKDYYVQVIYKADRADFGLTLSDIPKREIMSAVQYVFASRPEVMSINIACCRAKFITSPDIPHFRLELPDSVEGLQQRMSRKFRYNLKRERKMLEDAEGPVIFEEYSAGYIPQEIFTEFARMKQATHKLRYVPEGRGYSDYRRLISNAYIMRNSRNGEIISMVLSCEQCPIAYINNLTYEMKYSAYSPGKIIYHHYIETMMKKGYCELFLGAGGPDYKKHYGSVEETVYSVTLFRQFHKRVIYCVKHLIRKFLFRILSRKQQQNLGNAFRHVKLWAKSI